MYVQYGKFDSILVLPVEISLKITLKSRILKKSSLTALTAQMAQN